MTVKNATPHEVTLVSETGERICAFPPCGQLARVTATTVADGFLEGGIPVSRTVYGKVEGLPQPSPDTIYIVSALVAARCQGRDDVFVPAEQIRDEAGRVIGCKSLGRA